jgi:hypothetical protein
MWQQLQLQFPKWPVAELAVLDRLLWQRLQLQFPKAPPNLRSAIVVKGRQTWSPPRHATPHPRCCLVATMHGAVCVCVCRCHTHAAPSRCAHTHHSLHPPPHTRRGGFRGGDGVCATHNQKKESRRERLFLTGRIGAASRPRAVIRPPSISKGLCFFRPRVGE